MFINLFTGAPAWIWFVFGYLLFIGIKATEKRSVPIFLITIIPTIFFIISIKSVLSIYGFNLIFLSYWTIATLIGCLIGIIITNKTNVIVDKQNQSIEIPGSWLTFILSMIIFINKFFIGALSAIYPELKTSSIVSIVLLTITFSSGIFIGRALYFLQKYIRAK